MNKCLWVCSRKWKIVLAKNFHLMILVFGNIDNFFKRVIECRYYVIAVNFFLNFPRRKLLGISVYWLTDVLPRYCCDFHWFSIISGLFFVFAKVLRSTFETITVDGIYMSLWFCNGLITRLPCIGEFHWFLFSQFDFISFRSGRLNNIKLFMKPKCGNNLWLINFNKLRLSNFMVIFSAQERQFSNLCIDIQ